MADGWNCSGSRPRRARAVSGYLDFGSRRHAFLLPRARQARGQHGRRAQRMGREAHCGHRPGDGRNLVPDPERHGAVSPAWSPSGTAIAFSAAPGPTAGSSVGGGEPARRLLASRRIWVADAKGAHAPGPSPAIPAIAMRSRCGPPTADRFCSAVWPTTTARRSG